MGFHGCFFRCLIGLAFITNALLLGQGKPPASEVPEPYRQKFVRYVDARSMKEKALNLVGLTSEDVGRSFALIAGVSKYPNMSELERELPAATADIEELQNYLINQEFFDEVVVLRDGDVTIENLEYFLQDYFPDRIKRFPKTRFLFAYSGHGMTEGSKDYPTGFLLKSTARNFTDKQNSINMTVLRDYLDQVIEAGYQTLALINACHSGAFLSRRSFGGSGGIYFPKYGGAHAITAGGSDELTWHDPKLGKGSVFFEKLLAGLGGQADTFPVYPDGHRGDGIITVDEIATYLREEVSLATNQSQIPIPADLALNRSLGGFFFLNRQRMVAEGIVPDWNPSRATSFGVSAEEKSISAEEYYKTGQYDFAATLFERAAQSGNSRAAVYLGYMYEHGLGVTRDDVQAVSWYRKAAEAKDATGMSNLGFMYQHGRGGLSQNDEVAVSWYRKAAEAGDASGMRHLGFMYEHGLGGLPRDAAQAVSWYRNAAEGGDATGMCNLGFMYEHGRGGLSQNDDVAVSWYRKAAEAGDSLGMTNLGFMYEHGRGGLPKDLTQAVSWHRKAAEAGNALGMSNLGFMYENGQGGLPKDAAQAVSWYRKAAEAGDALGMSNLGGMYQTGRGGLPQDDAQAVSWYRKAAEVGNAPGMRNLGFMYENGRGGLPKDEAQAVSWYRKAAQLGDDYSQERLKELGQQ